MFAGKAGAYPSEASFRCYTLRQAPGFTQKHKTRLERLARDKRNSLLQKVVNYGQNFFYNIGPWLHIHNTSFFVTCERAQ